MLFIPTSTFYSWLQLYEYTVNLNFVDMQDTNDHAISAMAQTKDTKDPSKVVVNLIEFPFFATFVAVVEHGKMTTYSVQVLCHFSKFSGHCTRSPIQGGTEEVYAWRDLGSGTQHHNCNFRDLRFRMDENCTLSTPILQD